MHPASEPAPARGPTSPASPAVARASAVAGTPAAEERRLVERVLGREPGAADEFFARHFTPLYEFAHYRMGGSTAARAGASEVEDVVQDTFVTAFENLARFDGRSSVATWLAGIAKNKIRARRRKLAPLSLADAIEDADADIDAFLSSIDEQELPDWVLERRETAELVGAALSQLSLDHREALLSKYVDGASTAEVAKRAGTSAKAIESRLARARLAFAGVFTLLAKRRGGLE